MALGERHACVSGYCEGAGNARNHLEGYTSSMTGQRFFAPTPKDKWIASLEAHHRFSLASAFYEQRIDPLLIEPGLARQFAHIYQFRTWTHFLEQFRRRKPIIHNDIGLTQHAQPLDRDQVWIAGACSHQVDRPDRFTGLFVMFLAESYFTHLKPARCDCLRTKPYCLRREY